MILVTGCAGFIGAGVSRALLARGERVLGVDNFNSYYDPKLKRDRVAPLLAAGLVLEEVDLASGPALRALLERHRPRRIVHLAAQAGVRYSFENPMAYVDSNLAGFVHLLEGARALGDVTHFTYASSSSVYGANTKVPFSVRDPVDQPVSLYAATKRANELIAQVYARQFGIPLTGLRFFTVYGPWGRPDMAPLKFSRALLEGRTIEVYGEGDMRRDFTWIGDIVEGTIAALDETTKFGEVPHRVYNLGNNHPEELMHFIAVLARAAGREPVLKYLPMQPGDVRQTSADITETTRDLGWQPTTSIDTGLPLLMDWVRGYYGSH
jgi:UDP-glucuronate 4-epimerase